jgi:lipid-binding SYLF domain-containing protein
MPKSYWALTALATAIAMSAPSASRADPQETVLLADQVLHEGMTVPVREIPARLLADAQGLAIIPNVIKIGFIAGIRRGQGVVMVREPNGAWSLPQFVTLTGGSIGWQAGVQGTDVVLVFRTQKSVQGLLTGKFTIGADVAAAAGPVGRNAAAATDGRLKAEILSYSRSRGLFAGVSLDGSVIETNTIAQSTFYGAGPGQPPQRVPESAVRLVADVSQMTGSAEVGVGPAAVSSPLVAPAPFAGPQFGAPGESVTPEGIAPAPARFGMPNLAVPNGATLRDSLAGRATELNAIVDEGWRNYLALPAAVYEGRTPPSVEAMQQTLRQFTRVAENPEYQTLTSRPEFQATYRTLQQYTRQLSDSSRAQLRLPPPPRR